MEEAFLGLPFPKVQKIFLGWIFLFFKLEKLRPVFRVFIPWKIREYKKCFNARTRKLHFMKYTEFFLAWIFFVFCARAYKVQGSIFGNIRKAFFWENIGNFLSLELKSFIFRNVRNFFLGEFFFIFSSLGWTLHQAALYITTLNFCTIPFEIWHGSSMKRNQIQLMVKGTTNKLQGCMLSQQLESFCQCN